MSHRSTTAAANNVAMGVVQRNPRAPVAASTTEPASFPSKAMLVLPTPPISSPTAVVSSDVSRPNRGGAPTSVRPNLFVDVGTELLESIASPRAADGGAGPPLLPPPAEPPHVAAPAQPASRAAKVPKHSISHVPMRAAGGGAGGGRGLRGGGGTEGSHGGAVSRFKLLHAQARFRFMVAIRCAMFLVKLRRRWLLSRMLLHLQTVLMPRMAFRIQCVFRRHRMRRIARMRAAATRIAKFLKPKAMYLVIRRAAGLNALQRLGRGCIARRHLCAYKSQMAQELLVRVLRKPLRIAVARKRLAALRCLRDERLLFVAQAAVTIQVLVRDERIGFYHLQQLVFNTVQSEKSKQQRRRSSSSSGGSQSQDGVHSTADDTPLELQETLYPNLVELHGRSADALNAHRESISLCLRSMTTMLASHSTGSGISYAWSRDWGVGNSSSPNSPVLHTVPPSCARGADDAVGGGHGRVRRQLHNGDEGVASAGLVDGGDPAIQPTGCPQSSSSPDDSPAGAQPDGAQRQQSISNPPLVELSRLEPLPPALLLASLPEQQDGPPQQDGVLLPLCDAASVVAIAPASCTTTLTAATPTGARTTEIVLPSSSVSSPRFGGTSSYSVTPHDPMGSSLEDSPQHAGGASEARMLHHQLLRNAVAVPSDASPTSSSATAAAVAAGADDPTTMGSRLKSSASIVASRNRRRTTLRNASAALLPPDDVQVAFIALLDRTESIERKSTQNAILQSLHGMRQHVKWCADVLNCRDRVPRTFVSLLTQLSPSWILKLAVNLFEQEAEERLAVVDEYDATPLMFLGRPIMGSNSEKRRKRMKDLLQQRAERLFESYVTHQRSPCTSPPPQPPVERARRGTLVRPTLLRHSIVSLESATTAAAALNEQAVQFRNEGVQLGSNHMRRQTIVPIPSVPQSARDVVSPFAASGSRPSRSTVFVAVSKISPGGTASDDRAPGSGATSPIAQHVSSSRLGGAGFRLPIDTTTASSRASVFCGGTRSGDALVSPRFDDGPTTLGERALRLSSTDSNSPRSSGGGAGPFSRNSQFEALSERANSHSGRLSVGPDGAFGRSMRDASPRGQRPTFFADDLETSRRAITNRSPRTSTNFPTKRVTFSSISIEPLTSTSNNVVSPLPSISSPAVAPPTMFRPEALRSRCSGADFEMPVGSAWAAALAK